MGDHMPKCSKCNRIGWTGFTLKDGKWLCPECAAKK